MSVIQLLESWTEGLLRIAIGGGLAWIGVAEGHGYGLFLGIIGGIFILAGLAEIWSVEAAARQERQRTAMNSIHPALVECDIPVFFATTHGQTRRIAERFVALFRERGFSSRAIDVASSDADYVDWRRAQAVVVGAPLYAHKPQRSARAFIESYAPYLNVRPSMFVSVSLAAASERTDEREAAARIARECVEAAEWHVDDIVCLAGRLAYTDYGWLTTFVMKRIARRHGQTTDTSRDYEFTNWDEVTRAADSLVRRIAAERTSRAA